MRRLLRACVVAGLLPVALVTSAGVASAHPLGNFSLNHASRVVVAPSTVTVEHAIDIAEVPTFQARGAMDADSSGDVSPAEVTAWGASRCAELVDEVSLSVDGAAVALPLAASSAVAVPGQAGLPTTRVSCTLRAPVSLSGSTDLAYAETADAGRRGWHEVTAVGDGVRLSSSDVPAESPSGQLTAYPEDLLSSPLDVRAATLVAEPGGARLAREPSAVVEALPRGIDPLTRAFTDLVGARDLGVGIGLLALVISVLLGCVHALAPGHGKTVMAAYLVGQRGTRRQALILGATVTATHTAGVLLLGLLLTASTLVSPERALPALEATSGVLLAAVGAYLLRGALQRRRAGLPMVGHSHGPGGHSHGPGGHSHGPGGPSHGPGGHSHGPGGPSHGPASHRHGEHPHGDADRGSHAHDHPHGDHPHDDHEHGDHEHDDHPHDDHPHDDHPHDDHEHGATGHGGAGHGGGAHRPGPAVPRPGGRELEAGGVLVDERPGHEHDAHEHDAHDHAHPHPHPADDGRPLGRWTLAAMGIAGGLVPSPSALVVLLGATALGRAWFGVLLVVGYGLGMAVTLTVAGLLLLRARAALDRRGWGAGAGRRALALGQIVPVLTASVIVVVGVVLIWRGAALLV